MNNFISGFKQGFVNFGQVPAAIINFIILTLVYIFGVGLSSLLSKIFNKNFLHLKVNKKINSYYEKSEIGKGKDRLFRQY